MNLFKVELCDNTVLWVVARNLTEAVKKAWQTKTYRESTAVVRSVTEISGEVVR